MEKQGMYRWEMKSERDNGIGLTIHSESRTKLSQRRYWTGIPMARDQEEDKKTHGERI